MAGFKELGIAEQCSELLHTLGIKQPTPVQAQSIPVLLTGKDIISQAQTGTGKTLAFVLPMLERIKPEVPYLQGLIVTPTRELALQITAEVKKLLPAYAGVRVLAVYGGQDVEAQLHKLQGHVHIIIATPGRLLDHMRRETVRLSNVRMLVLDEADQMLHMGFLNDVEEILNQTPRDRQTMLFSATMPDKIRSLAGRILRTPVEVTVRAKQVTVKDTKQLVIETTDREKQDALVQMIEETQPYLGIIFCRTKRRASTLAQALQEMGYSCDELHGDLSQAKREQVMKKFRDARLQLLVATDIAARGLDVDGVTHVYNYDVPHDAESYIHRIGRTGRAGGAGVAITFAAPKDRIEMGVIENGIGMSIERRTMGANGTSVRVAAPARTAGAFGKRSSASAGRGSRGSDAGAGRGNSARGGRIGDRDPRESGRGPAAGGARGARDGASAGRGSRNGERGATRGGRSESGFGGESGAGRGSLPARGGRGASADSGVNAPAEEGKWWEKGKYFAPDPVERPSTPARRPGAGGPGNGRREPGAPKAQTGGRGERRYGGGAAAGERGAKPFGAGAERPSRGGGDDRAAGGRAGRPSAGPSGGGRGARGGSAGGGFGGGKPSFGGQGGFSGGRSGGSGGASRGGKPPARGPRGRGK